MAYRLAGQVMEGGVIGWAKSLAGTPMLLDGWVECNNQTLSDSKSIFNGKTMPPLNSTTNPQFLRGSAVSPTVSGDMGGSTGHTHCQGSVCEFAPFPKMGDCGYWDGLYAPTSVNSLPTYYEIVWVIAVRRRVVPIGGIVPWMKSITNMPALPGEFVECNGQTISDTQSPYSTAVPNLNGSGVTQRFLRGSSVQSSGQYVSGNCGGAETHTHTRSTTPWCYAGLLGCSSFCPVYLVNYKSNLPTYYETVYVIRIK